MKKRTRIGGTVLLVLMLAASWGTAEALVFSADNGGGLSASATFEASGTSLIVTLANTSPADVLDPAQVLTAVFFTLAGDPTLTPLSALLSDGSAVVFGQTGGGNVSGEWAYRDGLHGAPAGAHAGISTAGLGLFGPSDRFGPTNLSGPLGVGGLNYGITSAGDDLSTGNAPVTGKDALIQNSVTFTLSGLPPSGLGEITSVSFQYGTSLSEPNVSPVPEPATLWLLGSGLAALGGLAWRRTRRG